MPNYRVDLDFHGTASVIITAEDDEEACDKAEALLEGASFPGMKLEKSSVSLELEDVTAQNAEEWDG